MRTTQNAQAPEAVHIRQIRQQQREDRQEKETMSEDKEMFAMGDKDENYKVPTVGVAMSPSSSEVDVGRILEQL